MPSYALQSSADVLRELGSSSEGLSEAEISKRRLQYGFNELPEKKRSLVLLFLRQFNDILVYILVGALALSLLLPFLEEGRPTVDSFTDAFVILAILLLNAVLGFVQEYKAEQAVALLRTLTGASSRVRRSGQEAIIPSRELVPGDIVILEAGDRISADGRIIRVSHWEVDESSLTGESRPIAKQSEPLEREVPLAEQRNMASSGTLVAAGNAEIIVTAIGTSTEIGNIAKMVAEVELPETPLQRKMQKLSKMIGAIVLGLCIALVGIGLLYGFTVQEIVLMGATLAVSAVPEGLPAVITVCFAIGVRRMARRNALVRRLDALETLGSVNVICSDKTGTITKNKMAVVQTWVDGAQSDREQLLALIAASNNRASLPNVGDPTEIALLMFGKEKGVERLPIDEEQVPFSAEAKYMQTRHVVRERRVAAPLLEPGDYIFLKGAPEKILELAGNRGKEQVLAEHARMAELGLRVLAAAVQEPGESMPKFVGLLGMEDPPREGVAKAIAEAKLAGVRTVMITGDHAKTALAIARQIGIEGEMLQGKDIDTLSPDELVQRIQSVSVFARVTPMHKLSILEALKRHGCIVAMTGDGVNDAPAIKGAHVGIAMGRDGTQVAREAASIVLADDDYATIVRAIREGRRIYDNVRKFILFLLRSNFDEILFISTTLIIGFPLPYLPVHLLWINLMTDSLPALALGMEPEEADVMRRPPRPAAEHLLSGEWVRLAVATLLSFLIAFLYYFWLLQIGDPIEEARSDVVMLAITFELFMALGSRSRRPIWQIGFFGNGWMLGAIAITAALQIIVLYTPLGAFLHLVPLTLLEWGEILLLAGTGFLLFECFKYFSLPSLVHDFSHRAGCPVRRFQ